VHAFVEDYGADWVDWEDAEEAEGGRDTEGPGDGGHEPEAGTPAD
jgi:hypothetical protein